jgi:hypothetical protein
MISTLRGNGELVITHDHPEWRQEYAPGMANVRERDSRDAVLPYRQPVLSDRDFRPEQRVGKQVDEVAQPICRQEDRPLVRREAIGIKQSQHRRDGAQAIRPDLAEGKHRSSDPQVRSHLAAASVFDSNRAFSLRMTSNASATYSTSALPRAHPQLASRLTARRSLMNRQPTTCGSSP